ncbi:MAG: tetratricopeptide repeat protein [Silicimonas sp.]|nr:tetratricopeptide repeat protein [Silicimonas sp.]
MSTSRILRVGSLILFLTALTACDSAEERAEKHFQSGVELVEAGDIPRALVEFRNVFKLNDAHREARLEYAKASRSIGNIPESYSNYLRIVEEFPDDTQSRLALVEMAILTQNWDEAERHAEELLAAEGEVEGQDIAKLALEFRQAVLDQDASRLRELTLSAEELAATRPDDPILQRILIEGYLSEQEFEKALEVTDRAIASAPNVRTFYRVRASIIQRTGDMEELEKHLRGMIEQFPDDQEVKNALIRLLARDGKADDAEAFMRDELAAATEKTGAHVSLIAFLRQVRGDDAALAETEIAIAAYEDQSVFSALKSGILFDTGKESEAITLLQSVVDTAEPSEETDRFKITLAKMLLSTGNDVGARQLVETVLAGDASNVEALKMSASWLIESDQPDEAINALRAALDQEPEDAEAMSLMATAHQRNGDLQLAQDLLALAVEASGNAPKETLRFVQLMMQERRYRPAEDALVGALRASPGNTQLLAVLGNVYIASEQWSRVLQVESSLKRLETEQAIKLAENLQLQRIARQDGAAEATAFLQGLVRNNESNISARIALIQAKLRESEPDEALNLARELAAELPDDPVAQLVLGNTEFATRDFEAAKKTFQEIVDTANEPRAVMQLVRVLGVEGKVEEALGIIDAALEKDPGQRDLKWAKASFLERINDIEGAISIYEELYQANSASLVVANNLASLLATYRQDDESLERAFSVARRLRGTDVPPFQDTYGWILYRRGNATEAVSYLEPAARSLSGDPIVQFHLGKAYLDLGRNEDALMQFQAVLEVAEEEDTREQIIEAKEQVERLTTEEGQ